jgi:hypothetical protein
MAIMIPNNAINSDVQKRRFALLLHAGYGERSPGARVNLKENGSHGSRAPVQWMFGGFFRGIIA